MMKRRVLFLCTGNSARSQIAEALLPLIAPGGFEAFSAGTNPCGVNPCAVEAMAELDVDMSAQRSKHVSEFADQHFDYVVTVCDRAKESCPILPGAERVLHWSFEDPAAAPPSRRLEVFRRVRDDIADTLCRFLIGEAKLSAASLQCYCCDSYRDMGLEIVLFSRRQDQEDHLL
jgi:arsenate reductase (thioredoxin)